YQVAIAGLLPSQIAQPVRTIFRKQKNLTFQMGEATQISLDEKYVKLNGSIIAYDFLIIATGGRTNFFGFDALEKSGFQIKDLETAVRTRNRLLSMFERASHEGDAEKRRALLTFVIVGGGPTGVETAGALAELISHVLVKEYPPSMLKEARVVLLEATSDLLGAYPPELRQATLRLLRSKNVQVRLNAKMADFNGQRITLGDGSQIETQTVIWTAGVKATEMAEQLDVEKASGGRIKVLPTLQLPGRPEVFVVGDTAFLEENGQPLPMIATVAIQQGTAAAENIRRILDSRPLKPFRYRDPGLLATIGRNAAVARIFGVSFSGFIAWVIWVFLHIYRIVGFRNRLLILFNWMWDYFFYDNQVRLITKE
ncbi:MAG: NAD(P)/FAD-dependent oxidoreductase, partial [Chloroflexi bacterium]|nr:NAD(P)/FAD-dependent oxidoreductase [Chloroflexota bacterium]